MTESHDKRRKSSLTGPLVALLGTFGVGAGLLSEGPDLLSGVVFGGMFLLAGIVLWRRHPSRSEQQDTDR